MFRPGGRDLNLRAAYIHLVGDALGSIGVIVTGIVIVTTGWRYADPLVGVLIGIFLVVSSWSVLRDSTLVLLEATPRGLDAEVDRPRDRGSARRRRGARPARLADHERLSVALGPRPRARGRRLPRRSAARRSRCCGERFAITHTTLQVDHEHTPGLLTISPATRP